MLTTYFGREYIQYSNKICCENGKTIVYNDTDSVYYYHEIAVFVDILDRYLQGEFSQKILSKKLVRRSIKHGSARATLKYYYAKKLKSDPNNAKILANLNDTTEMFEDILNRSFIEKSGSNILKQVREETLYPAVFMMKKKYFGKIHTVSYVDKYGMSDLLIRGIAIRSGNCTGFLRQFNEKLLFDIIDANIVTNISANTSISANIGISANISISKLVLDSLFDLYNYEVTNDNLHLFENVVRYKSNKANKALMFVERMQKLHNSTVDEKLRDLYKIPSELESVYFIYTQPNRFMTIKGNNYVMKKCEIAEYKEVILHLGLSVDMHSYILSVLSTCAQFLTYDTASKLYENGIENNVYAEKIKRDLVKKCTQIKKDSQAEKDKSMRKKHYKHFFASNYKHLKARLREEFPTIAFLLVMIINVKKNLYDDAIILANKISLAMKRLQFLHDGKQVQEKFNAHLKIIDRFKKHVNHIAELFYEQLFTNLLFAFDNNLPEIILPEIPIYCMHYLEMFAKSLQRYIILKWLCANIKITIAFI
jgi:hypothetical protein